MSRIPAALNNIMSKYDIELGIFNKHTNYDTDYMVGKENLPVLDHGTYDDILKKLLELRLEILEEYKKKTNLEEGIEHGPKR